MWYEYTDREKTMDTVTIAQDLSHRIYDAELSSFSNCAENFLNTCVQERKQFANNF